MPLEHGTDDEAPPGDVTLDGSSGSPEPIPTADRPVAPCPIDARRAARAALIRSARFAMAAAGAVLIGLLFRSGIHAHEKNTALWIRVQSVTSECQRLEERRSALGRESYALENDSFYIEKRIRQDWRQLREGEILLERPRSR
jgi:hypothetical protein